MMAKVPESYEGKALYWFRQWEAAKKIEGYPQGFVDSFEQLMYLAILASAVVGDKWWRAPLSIEDL